MSEIKELYIEPTSNCNLACVMCSRNYWKNEATGHMDLKLFDKLIDEIPCSVSRIFFGGVGEPLCHPDIVYMLKRAKQTGRVVEIITNGTLLTGGMSEKIVDAKIDVLWISIDSMETKSYENIRVGACFSSVMDNIRNFNLKRAGQHEYVPLYSKNIVKLGAVFVLMKGNQDHFGNFLKQTRKFGISYVKATHLIPYNESQLDQVCYERVLSGGMYRGTKTNSVHVDIPFMDTLGVHGLLPSISNPALSFSVMGAQFWIKENHCRFVEEGISFVRWDGEVCPCMALLHENMVYLRGIRRTIGRSMRSCSFGNANEHTLSEIWQNAEYTEFRKHVTDSDFPPCARCSPDLCHLIESNEKDCLGNKFPTCGACLWAQGLVQCP